MTRASIPKEEHRRRYDHWLSSGLSQREAAEQLGIGVAALQRSCARFNRTGQPVVSSTLAAMKGGGR